MTEQEIVDRLVSEFGYHEPGARSVARELLGAVPDVQIAFREWWTNGSYPRIEIEGFSVAKLEAERGMTVIGALLTLDWLASEPEDAREALAHRTDRIF